MTGHYKTFCKKSKKHDNTMGKFFREKLRKILTEKKSVVDIGGSLRVSKWSAIDMIRRKRGSPT